MLAEDSFSGSAEAESRALIQQMSQSLGLLRVAFDSTGEAMLIVDESSAVRWANQQAADLWGGGITFQMVVGLFQPCCSFITWIEAPWRMKSPVTPYNKPYLLKVVRPISSKPYLLLLLKRRN